MDNGEYLKMYKKLGQIEARIIAIETNMCWVKKVISWIIIGVAASVGIQLPEFI